ncbi:MAG: beta-galactosidase trimerization domain-containing protein [Armatimonadota bacterium]
MSSELMRALFIFAAVMLLVIPALAIDAEAYEAVKAAQAYRAKGEAVTPAPDGTYFCEAEEFKVTKPGWEAQPWGANYYAATFANCFLSRKAFLGAPEQTDDATATMTVDIKQAGKYLVMARYEATYRFETQFTIKVEQGGRTVFNKLYGARDNVKIWAFSEKYKKEVAWSWGAVENVVWEGYLGEGANNTYAELQPGRATITLIAGKQQGDAAKRNVDLIMLTTDEQQVKDRVAKEGYLPLDGWLTQADDVFIRATNLGQAPATVKVDPQTQHSPYWVHIRHWKPVAVTVDPGQTSDWVDIGGTMDTLNDGQWGVNVAGSPCKLEYGARTADGNIVKIKEYANVSGSLNLIAYADVRYSRLIRTRQEGVDDLLEYLKAIPMQGKTPTQTMIVAHTSIPQLNDIFGTNGRYLKGPNKGTDLRSQTLAQLEAFCQKLSPEERASYLYISMGDEIGSTDGLKPQTELLRKYLPNAGIGANYSPHGGATHAYLGGVNHWVTAFRDDVLTMPWGEDYIWQLPMGTPQMNSINLDMFRAGIRGKPNGKIMYYVMPHMPGNIPEMWRRLWYSAMGHGAKHFNLFEFHPVWTAYTENHVTGKEMYGMVLKTFREYGTFEDIIQAGQVRPSQLGLWFSETADKHNDYANSGGAAKRALYIAIINQQVPLDFLVDQDAADGTLNQYKVLYLTDRHVSKASSAKIAAWVQNGGRLFATAGAGMYDENNQPNTMLRGLLGVNETKFDAPAEALVGFVKQDLPFVQPLDEVTFPGRPAPLDTAIPAYGAVSRVTAANGATVVGTFKDGSPAYVTQMVGKGYTAYCGFLPGLSYFQPAIPKKPLDRGTTPDAMAHYLPTTFDQRLNVIVGSFVPAQLRPVTISAPLVEATVIESKVGTAITLTNWTNTPVKGLQVTANIPVPTKKVTLSTGKPVKVGKVNGKTVFTLDLDIADTIILR